MNEKNNTSELMNVEHVAAYLGLSESAIYHRVHQQAIPFIKLGGSLRFRRSDIDAWLEEHTVQPQSA